MNRTPAVSRHKIAWWLRLCLQVLLIVGVASMHQMVSTDTAAAAHHSVVEHDPIVSGVSAPGSVIDGDGSAMAETCGLLAVCLAMAAGIWTLAMWARRQRPRVLWMWPAAREVFPPRRVTLYERRPLGCIPILRC